MVRKLTSLKLFSLIVSLLFTVVLIVLLCFIPTVSSRSARLEHDLDQRFLAYESLQIDPATALQQVKDTGRLSLASSDLQFDLELVPHDLRAAGYRAEVFGANGVGQTIDIGLVHTFKGRARGSQSGVQLPQIGEARFTIDASGVEGLIITPTEHYFVEPAKNFSDAAMTSDYVIYRESDVVRSTTAECGVTLSEQVNQKAEALQSKNAQAINQILPLSREKSSRESWAASDSSLMNLGVIDANFRFQPFTVFSNKSTQITSIDIPLVQSQSVEVPTPAAQGCGAEAITNGQQLQRTLKSGCAFEGGQLTDIYSFSGKAGQEITITMTSNAFDTQLYLYYGPVNALTIAAQDDNGGGGTNSRIPAGVGTFRLPATNTFYIYATSVLPNQIGNYSIALSAFPPPPNDHFANAQLITGIPGSVAGSTQSATNEIGEPDHVGQFGGASIWYRWQAPTAGLAAFETTLSDFDTLLAVYKGETLTSLTTISSNDNANGTLQSKVTFATTPGSVYYIAVDGVHGTTGNVMLSWGPGVLPPNDAFGNATQISGPFGTVFDENRLATKELGEPNHAGNMGGASIWYRWQAPVTGPIIFSTTFDSNFDTLLAAYTGSTVSSLTVIASNDDDPLGGLQSKVEFNAVSGTVYYLALDGFNSARGNSTLSWTPGFSTPTPTPTPTPSPTPTPTPTPTPIPTPTTALLQQLRIATEADNEYVVLKGGPAASSQAILSTLNQVEGLFEVELGLTFRVVYQSAWNTSSDPFSSTNPTELLGELSNQLELEQRLGSPRRCAHVDRKAVGQFHDWNCISRSVMPFRRE